MFCGGSERVSACGRPVNLLTPEYGFVETPWRGHAFTGRAFVMITAWDMARAPLRPALLVGSLYPPSFLRFSKVSRVFTMSDPKPPWVAACLERVANQHYAGRWAPSTGVVELPTIPEARLWRRPRTPFERAVIARYVAQNPCWRDGFGLLGAVILDRRMYARIARGLTHRLLRDAWQWRPSPPWR